MLTRFPNYPEWNILQPIFIERLKGAKLVVQKRRQLNKIVFRLDILRQRIDHACSNHEKNADTPLPHDERPLPEDIAVLEPFRSTIFQDTEDEPECLFMGDQQFGHLLLNWHRERKEYLLSLLPRELTENLDGSLVHDPLSLEVAYFCGDDHPGVQLYYQAICRIRPDLGALPDDAPTEVALLTPGEFHRPWQWDRDRWSFDTDRYTAATTMMIYLGINPRTATPWDFLCASADIELQCMQCEPGGDHGLRNCWSAVSFSPLTHETDGKF
jgi:hypothetical protein